MKILVVGSTGVVGRRAVSGLVAAGHDVAGLARGPEKVARLTAQGARPVVFDPFDATATAAAAVGFDAVCNLATHIPGNSRLALRSAWKENDDIRRRVSANLVEACLAHGIARYVQESIAFLYRDGGDTWIVESSPLDVAGYIESAVEAERNAARVTEAGGAGVTLRFGQFYAPESAQTHAYIDSVKRRLAPSIGSADGYMSPIHADDAAAAVVAAMAAPGGIYNIVDDQPVTRRLYFQALADALGVSAPVMLPRLVATIGGEVLRVVGRSLRVSNASFKA